MAEKLFFARKWWANLIYKLKQQNKKIFPCESITIYLPIIPLELASYYLDKKIMYTKITKPTFVNGNSSQFFEHKNCLKLKHHSQSNCKMAANINEFFLYINIYPHLKSELWLLCALCCRRLQNVSYLKIFWFSSNIRMQQCWYQYLCGKFYCH